MDWRNSHAWLRGYSDARAGKDEDPTPWRAYEAAYRSGYEYGSRPIRVITEDAA